MPNNKDNNSKQNNVKLPSQDKSFEINKRSQVIRESQQNVITNISRPNVGGSNKQK